MAGHELSTHAGIADIIVEVNYTVKQADGEISWNVMECGCGIPTTHTFPSLVNGNVDCSSATHEYWVFYAAIQ